jgi:hypothetical protein
MLYLTRRGLLVGKNSQTLSFRNATDKWLTLNDLLPESGALRRLEEVCPNGIIPVSPIPSNIDDLKNISDLKRLFRRPHVQYLHARYFSKQSNTKEDAKHIFWH